jgi:4-hydroxybenzoate polyprenyltransferase
MHYWWPLAVGWSYVVVAQRAMELSPNVYGLTTLLCGILAAYSLDRVFDPSERDGGRVSLLLAAVGAVAAAACAAAAWHLPFATLTLVPLLGLVSMCYPTLKRVPLFKFIALPVVWIWAVLALPFGDGSLFGWRVLLHPVVLPLLLLNTVGCLLCDVKDETRDRASGVRSVPALLGRTTTLRLALLLSFAAAAVALAEDRPGILISAAALSAAAFVPSLVAEDTVGPLLVDAILTLPGVLIVTRLV